MDGLGVNGKSTLARMISQEIEVKNFNIGVIYRCIALEIISKNLDVENVEELLRKIFCINVDFDDDKVILSRAMIRLSKEEIQ